MYRRFLGPLLGLLIVAAGVPAAAQTYDAPLLGTGDDERVDAAEPCASEPDFIAGQYTTAAQLQVGGNAWGCGSEWGACAEFDFAFVGAGNDVLSATLILRYTGYGDDAGGLPYLAIYAYDYAGGPVDLPRVDLDDHTALDIFALTGTTNVDVAIDVTDRINDLLADGIYRAGFFVCGVFSEVGYSDLVYFGGASHAHPPRLALETSLPVAAEPAPWGRVKALYR